MNDTNKMVGNIWELLRVLLGLVYLWAFFDKTLGLGFATTPENAWLAGTSPTYGYLMHGTKGPFVEFFQALAGNPLVDVLFMLGILFIGATLLSGIMLRLGALAGMAMYALFYFSGSIPPEYNPLIDEHVINFVLMFGIFTVVPNTKYCLGSWWQKQAIVQKYPLLR